MTTIPEAILLGIIQGITEWLPVSSSGHLAIAEHFLGISEPLLMNIFLHLGTLIVIFIVFYKDLLRIAESLVKLDFRSEHGKLGLLIIIGSVPTAIIGFAFKDIFASFFTNMKAVAIALLITGAILFFSERFPGKRNPDLWDSIIIGAAQGIAIIPGISRSGATISAAMVSGVEKSKAAVFSFLLMIPAVIGAAMIEYDASAIDSEILPIIIGTLTATVIGFIALKHLLRLIKQKRFHIFSYYCLLLGIALLAYSIL